MNNDKLIWLDKPQSTQRACIVCNNRAGNNTILQARHWQAEKGLLQLATCGACASAWFLDAAERNAPYPSSQETLQDPNFILLIYHYFELVNGLDWKVPLLESLPHENFKNVMEVGCNVGITLDYCKTVWKLDQAIGVEPSAYGVLGGQLLELEIKHDFLANLPELGGTPFDLIFATEVIEHVPDPLEFIRELRSHLTPTGILLLTTPRASFLEKNAPLGELYAALSPGSHYFLLSENKLRALALEAGFEWVQIEPRGLSHIAILAHTNIELSNASNTEAQLLAYYEKKQATLPKDERIKLGYLLNYAIALNKNGKTVLAADTAALTAMITRMLYKDYALDLDNPEASLKRITACNTIFDLGKQIPYHLPAYLYWNALHNGHQHHLVSQLEFARLICLTGLKVDFPNLFVYHELLQRIDSLLENTQTSESAMKIRQVNEEIHGKIPELNRMNRINPKSTGRRIWERLKRYRYSWS